MPISPEGTSEKMDFSEPYKVSGPPPCHSPDGKYVCHTAEYRLIIRETETLRVVQLYSCVDRISAVEWSANSLYVMCTLCARNVIQVCFSSYV